MSRDATLTAPADTPATLATGRLERLFNPRSLVLVGASDSSAWSQLIHGNIVASGFAGPVYAVNRRGVPAHGRPGFTRCADLPAPPDLAYLFVPAEGVAKALADVAEAGIAHAIVLSSGFAETGAEGAAAQARLAALARQKGIALLGPNSLGFNNYGARVAVSAFPVDGKAMAGGLSVISQSGATAHVIAQFARQQGIGLNCVVATGNEAGLGLVDVLDHFVGDPATRAIALFAETIKDPAGFRQVAARASAAGKPIVVVKVGKSELASRLAEAHTGAVTGDDAVFDAICRAHGVIRMDSLEAMVVAAGLMADVGEITGEIGLLSISGGACELIADRAAGAGLRLAPFTPATRARLEGVLSAYGAVFNPLDVTGAAVRDPSLFTQMLEILSADPAMGFLGVVQDVPPAEGDTLNEPILAAIGAGLAAARVPGTLINQALQPIGPYSRAVLARCAIPRAIGGVDHAVAALAALQRWSE
ncbi:MAG TPA: CoA-binding protein, partial [Novosphingobium sp.]|nr:CoA-binding protein [Novosphingobium sp.]